MKSFQSLSSKTTVPSATPLLLPQHKGERQTRYIRKYYPPPLCFAQQNIGEVSARTEGLTPTAKKLMKSFQSLSSKTTVLSVSPLLLPKHRGCNPSHSLKFRSIPSDFLPNRYYDLRIEFSSITMRRALYKAPIAFLKLFLLHWK